MKRFYRTWPTWGCNVTTRRPTSAVLGRAKKLYSWRSKGDVRRNWEAIWRRSRRPLGTIWPISAISVSRLGHQRFSHFVNFSEHLAHYPILFQLPKIVLPPRKDRQSSAPPSALPRPPRTLKPPRKIEYGRLSESGSSKSNSKSEYEMKTSSLKRQSPTASGSKNYVDIKSELQMALNPTKNNAKTYGTIKTDTANNITKIYYSNKPDFISNASYQRLPESPTSSDSVKKFSGGSSGKKIMFMRSSPSAQHQSREGSISSGSNSRSSPKLQEMQYQQLSRSRTRTPPKYLHLNPMGGVKFGNLGGSNNSSPTKPTLPSSSVLYHQAQAQSMDWKQPPIQHQRGNSGRSNSGSGGENKYRIQFWSEQKLWIYWNNF